MGWLRKVEAVRDFILRMSPDLHPPERPFPTHFPKRRPLSGTTALWISLTCPSYFGRTRGNSWWSFISLLALAVLSTSPAYLIEKGFCNPTQGTVNCQQYNISSPLICFQNFNWNTPMNSPWSSANYRRYYVSSPYSRGSVHPFVRPMTPLWCNSLPTISMGKLVGSLLIVGAFAAAALGEVITLGDDSFDAYVDKLPPEALLMVDFFKVRILIQCTLATHLLSEAIRCVAVVSDANGSAELMKTK